MKSIPFSGSHLVRRAVNFLKDRSQIEQYLYIAIAFFLFIAILLGFERLSDHFSVTVPAQGGRLVEGVVGFPDLVNPVFASSNAEHDLVRLIYSGLMKVSESGELEPDLAEGFEVSEDGMIYTFYLRSDARFHDGVQVTAEDVVFTIEQIKSPSTESPLTVIWSDASAEVVDDSTVAITIGEPDASFLEQFTVGIVPKHLWENAPVGSLRFIELASYPVGSGPFQVKKIERSESIGIPTKYVLSAFDGYIQGRPHLDRIDINFYSSEDELVEALGRGEIKTTALLSPQSLDKINEAEQKIITAPMQRIFGIFFNQTEGSPLAEKAVRRAIREAIDQEKLVNDIFSNYARPAYSPFPESGALKVDVDTENNEDEAEKQFLPGEQILANADWELDPETKIRTKDDQELAISISTANSPEFVATAEFIKDSLEQIGFAVEVEVYDIAHLSQEIIRPRNYEVLLFGEAFDRTVDLYPFWHSSQRDDPGLNVARYASSSVDQLLKDLRTERDPKERTVIMESIEEHIHEDIPAIFLYSPEFLYLSDKDIKNVTIPRIVRSSDRFSNINNWYIYTDTIWKIFLK